MLTKDKVELADKITKYLYLSGLGLMLIALPIFNLGMSIAGFWLAGVWIIDFIFDCSIRKTPWTKFKVLYENKAAMLILSIFLLHVLGLAHTTDYQYAFKDLRIKLPLFFLPIVIGSLPKISFEERDRLLNVFLLSLTFSLIVCFAAYYGFFERSYEDVRSITNTPIVNISHIRLSLMAVLGLFIVWSKFNNKSSLFILWFALGLIYIYFLWLVESMTGFLILAAGVFIQLTYSIIVSKSKRAQVYYISLVMIGIMAVGSYLTYCVANYYDVEEVDYSQLDLQTEFGEDYKHDIDNRQLENGHYVWLYIAPIELETTWNQKANIPYSEKDASGQNISGTLIRYITSKGLRKDAEGVNALNLEDIKKIESGIASVCHDEHKGIRKRVDKVLFEFDSYYNGGNPSGNSVTQRFEFWNAAIGIFKNNTWIGVGTGDVPASFIEQYAKTSSQLETEYRLRAHNQYLTIALTFGIFGLLWFLIALVYPIIKLEKHKDFLFFSFFIIAVLSFLWEDTLETQAGISFFSFFICFFLFSNSRKTE